MTTAPQEASAWLIEFINWGKDLRFDKIALFFGMMISKICPFRTKHGYDAILIGTAGQGVENKHYLGWNVYNNYLN